MKQIKLFGVLAIALTLGLAACGNNNSQPGGQSQGGDVSSAEGGESTKHKHDWGEYVVTKEATCTEDGEQERTCKGCGEKQTKTIKAAHQWGEWQTVTAATCTVKGEEKRTCARCNEVETRETEMVAHTYVKDTAKEDVAPTCEVAGTNYLKCSVCGAETEETVAALGHEYAKDADGNDIVTWTVKASCEIDGVGSKTCTREGCGHVEPVTEAHWGHKVSTKDTAEPAPGKAAVRVYDCENPGCDMTFFGFKATETSPNAGKLVEEADPETGEIGKRFWGRPIGNAMELTDDGSAANGADTEKIYDPTVSGDLFEYVFDLTQEQINIMGETVACYVDARPANYLNGQDFWACDPSAEEWTPGYYIEGEKAGQPIADYRYILYVDGHPVEFDHRMKAPVTGNASTNIARGEFLMPYVFRFTPGEHSISLRMAGGYRSTFYNFTFRPYQVPADIVASPEKIEIRQDETAQITCAEPGVVYKSANERVATVDEKGLVKGVSVGTTTITISKEGAYFPTTIPVTINEKFGVVRFEAEVEGFVSDPADAVKAGNIAQWGTTMGIAEFAKDATYTVKFTGEKAGKFNLSFRGYGSIEDLAAAMSVKINGVDVVVSGSISTSWQAATVVFGQADLIVGENTMVIKALGDTMPKFDYFRFEPVPEEIPHEHVFGTPAAQTDEAESTIASCECGMKHIKWNSKKFNAEASVVGTPDSNENGSTGIKFSGSVYNKTSGTASTGDHVVYNVNVPEAVASAKLYMRFNRKDKVSAFSAPSGDQSPAYYQNEGGDWVKYPWRYKLFINDVEVPFVSYAEGTEPQTEAKKEVEYAFPCTFALKAGVNKVELQKWGGYTATIVDFTFEYGA